MNLKNQSLATSTSPHARSDKAPCQGMVCLLLHVLDGNLNLAIILFDWRLHARGFRIISHSYIMQR